jgi:DNA-binding ferritin-like protein
MRQHNGRPETGCVVQGQLFEGKRHELQRGNPESILMGRRDESLAEPARRQAMALLALRHADCFALRTLIRQARRSLTGWSSFARHRQLREIEADLRDYCDLLGGRLVQLGTTAEDGIELGANPSRAGERQSARPAGAEDEACLPEVIAKFAAQMRNGSDELDRSGDGESAGLLAEAARVADTWLWRLDVADCRRPAFRIRSTAVGKSFLNA